MPLDVRSKSLTRGQKLGQRITARLQALAKSHNTIADVRGLGAMLAIELCKGSNLHKPDADLTKRVVQEAMQRGLVLLSCGTYSNVIRILVLMTASDAIVDEGLGMLVAALCAASGAAA